MSGVQWRFVQVLIVHCHLTALIFKITNIGLDCCGCMHFLGSKLAEVQKDLECSNEECKKLKQDIEILQVLHSFSCPSRSLCRLNWPRFFKSVTQIFYTTWVLFQEKALEVDYLELKEAQHQQFMFDLKNQLRKVYTISWHQIADTDQCLRIHTGLKYVQIWHIVICWLRTEWRASWARSKQAYPTWTWVGRSSTGIFWPPDRASGISIKSCISFFMIGGNILFQVCCCILYIRCYGW